MRKTLASQIKEHVSREEDMAHLGKHAASAERASERMQSNQLALSEPTFVHVGVHVGYVLGLPAAPVLVRVIIAGVVCGKIAGQENGYVVHRESPVSAH